MVLLTTPIRHIHCYQLRPPMYRSVLVTMHGTVFLIFSTKATLNHRSVLRNMLEFDFRRGEGLFAGAERFNHLDELAKN